jgi:cardiolipin synthase
LHYFNLEIECIGLHRAPLQNKKHEVGMTTASVSLIIMVILQITTLLRVMLRPHREPAARIAWIAVVASVPLLGVLSYWFFGEVSVGGKHISRTQEVLRELPKLEGPKSTNKPDRNELTSQKFGHLFKLGKSISGFDPIGGNAAILLDDSEAMIEALVADIDAAQDHVHLLFYIWLPDISGCRVVEALKRAAARGVTCRAMADNMGSRDLIRSPHWQAMQDAGVKIAILLPIGNILLRALIGRIDLRNHRKIVVIDGDTTYCGSQNCADAAFLPKQKFAPWVDTVLRFEGPVARQNQHLFISDWMTETDEDISDLLRLPPPKVGKGFPAQVFGTGPTDRSLAMSQMFVALIAAARQDLTISTPYFVPNEPIQSALQSAAYRGVNVSLIMPKRNDSWIVQAASRSFYHALLESGISIYEYTGGLLHAKSLTIDGEFMMVGSANIDRRSFDLNYENNMLIHDPKCVADMIERQQQYIARSNICTHKMVDDWSLGTKLWNNTLAVLGPIL